MHILQQVPSPCTLRRDLKRIVFGERVRYPRCECGRVKKIKQEERWRCKKCRHPFSITSCCWLKGTKLPLETIWLLLWCWQKQIPVKQACDIIGISYPTTFNWYSKFRDKIPKERLDTILGGNVVCDEMFTKGNCIMGAKEKGTRNIVMKVLHEKDPNKRHAIEFLTRFLKTHTKLSTDGSGIYKGCDKWHKLKHEYEVHRRFEFTLTAEIEGLWGVFRTFVRRMYHHVTNYKLEELVCEFCLRFRKDEIFENPLSYLNVCLKEKPFAL